MNYPLIPSNFKDVGDFHRKFDLPTSQDGRRNPVPHDPELMEFRVKFMQEELDEFKEGLEELDHEKMFDALLDLAYVVFGTAHFLNYPWQAGWDAVQSANMKKVRAAKDGSDSKRGSSFDVVKPPGWTAPDIGSVLRIYGFELKGKTNA
jgi:predicted HAD superfamily Cof-like phosphohydrolase